MTASLWRELATYAATFTVIAAVMFGYEGHTRTAVALGAVGGAVFLGALTIQALGIA